MFTTFPRDPQVFIHFDWTVLKPFTEDLAKRPLSSKNLKEWMQDWSDMCRVVSEIYARLWTATTLNTADQQAKLSFNTFLDQTFTPWLSANQALKQRLLMSGLQPDGFELALRNLKVEAEIYHEQNLPLLSEEKKLVNEYDEIIGAQTVLWDGKELTTTQLLPIALESDRSKREKAWRLEMERKLADRQKVNETWCKMLEVRKRLAAQAGYSSYRDYRWKELLRFDYTPEDCFRFHQAIKQVAVPAAYRVYEKRRKQLGLVSLRPWDLSVDPIGRDPLSPFQTINELVEKVAIIFHKVEPQLGAYFKTMLEKGLLDLENRKDKAPGAYCIDYDMVMLPFVFENAVGLHTDVSTLIHESGHAFHVFEEAHLPYYHQVPVGMEIGEVASSAMELLASRFLVAGEAGFYTEEQAARALIEHLEEALLFWPYMAVVDAFQHWAYINPVDAMQPALCDQMWSALWSRYMPGVDWGGLEEALVSGWQRKQHIFEAPFYYIEYGMAYMGAFQIWANSMKDYKAAVAAYRRALAMGGTATLPQLYEAAGAHFAFDASALTEAINLIEGMIEKLERMG